MTIVGKIEFEPMVEAQKIAINKHFDKENKKKKHKYKCFGCSRQCSLKMFHNMPSLCVLNSNNKAIWLLQ
jgi:hypothetical protein